jgi:hypothetical protein
MDLFVCVARAGFHQEQSPQAISGAAGRLREPAVYRVAGAEGIEPPTFGFGNRRSTN